jgi:hypothetical protein
MKKLFKEPLLHFLLIGAALFGLHALLQPRQPEAPSARRIVISQGDIDRLRLTWQMQWQRPPTTGEWRGLLQAHVREEVLYREALALGLDRDDTIVRRRLAQKFEFLAQDLAASRPPPTPSWAIPSCWIMSCGRRQPTRSGNCSGVRSPRPSCKSRWARGRGLYRRAMAGIW